MPNNTGVPENHRKNTNGNTAKPERTGRIRIAYSTSRKPVYNRPFDIPLRGFKAEK